SSTVFQMWVDPNTAGATPGQLAAIAAAGPVFSLTLGAIGWTLYRWRFRQRPSGLVFLMLATVCIYSFLGPMSVAALGGDFNRTLTCLNWPKTALLVVSGAGLVALATFMFFMGWELVRWAPRGFGRVKAVAYTTVAPMLIGGFLLLAVYWPLPSFMVTPTLTGNAFWVFAIAGAISGHSAVTGTVEPVSSFTKSDLFVLIVALAIVRSFVHGVRLG
ncbi:MAG TPA: hypothetical protein VG759_19130, partial [Candidatus Angelobacter sp.]|nr:hypothetical protein [Candidatus Angelobacter sp.]